MEAEVEMRETVRDLETYEDECSIRREESEVFHEREERKESGEVVTFVV